MSFFPASVAPARRHFSTLEDPMTDPELPRDHSPLPAAEDGRHAAPRRPAPVRDEHEGPPFDEHDDPC